MWWGSCAWCGRVLYVSFLLLFRELLPPCLCKTHKNSKNGKKKYKIQKMQFWELSFGGSDVLFIVYNYIHRSYILVLFSFLFRVFQARWLAYTCHHRTWQSVGSERYCRDLSLPSSFRDLQVVHSFAPLGS